MSSDRLADIGVVGLAVMGENLVLNMEGKGFTVACFNRTVAKVDAFVSAVSAGGRLLMTMIPPAWASASRMSTPGMTG